MKLATTVRVDLSALGRMQERIRSDQGALLQLTRSINRRMTRYMPFGTGTLATKLKQITAPGEITVQGPYARYQYYGEVMVDPVTGAAGFLDANGEWKSRTKAPHVPKVRSGRPLRYDQNKNPLAGPFWDRRLMAAEGDQIKAELARYIMRGEGNGE